MSSNDIEEAYKNEDSRGYELGYRLGYKAGYIDGFKDAYKEGYKEGVKLYQAKYKKVHDYELTHQKIVGV